MILFQFDIIQRKVDGNKCNIKALWQNELVVEKSYVCPTYKSGIGLYMVEDYNPLNGQVRNFSYIKK